MNQNRLIPITNRKHRLGTVKNYFYYLAMNQGEPTPHLFTEYDVKTAIKRAEFYSRFLPKTVKLGVFKRLRVAYGAFKLAFKTAVEVVVYEGD